jgi:hypothetical protein
MLVRICLKAAAAAAVAAAAAAAEVAAQGSTLEVRQVVLHLKACTCYYRSAAKTNPATTGAPQHARRPATAATNI